MTKRRPRLQPRDWVPPLTKELAESTADSLGTQSIDGISATLDELVRHDHRIHRLECVNLDPATNTMSRSARAALGSDLGTRPSLGYPGAKYEPGLEAIERIELIAAELAAEVFDAGFVELRVPSGSIANLYAFMACASPGDAIIVPPSAIGGHVTHHRAGAAGLYGLEIHEAPIDPDRYTIDADSLADLAGSVRPKVLSVGGSLNLTHHPVAAIREIADAVGARVLFDAAHLSGLVAGRAWPNPLHEGAHVMTMSTYKSLGGPPSGLIVTNDAELAERIERIAFPGLTANFDVSKSAALAYTMLDWQAEGEGYASSMVGAAMALAARLDALGIPVFATPAGHTMSHAFAVDARSFGGIAPAMSRLREANLLASTVGMPSPLDVGLRLGTNEIVRWGATVADMDDLAALIARGLTIGDPSTIAPETTAFRRRFTDVGFHH